MLDCHVAKIRMLLLVLPDNRPGSGALVAQALVAQALAACAHGAGALATLLAGLANHRSVSSLSGPAGWLGLPPSSGLPGQGWPLAPLHM